MKQYKLLILLLLALPSLAGAQEEAETALQRKLRVCTIIASIAHHRGPWNSPGLKKDTILLGKTAWWLNRRGDVYRSAEYYSADTNRIEFQWEKLHYYNRDSFLFHSETYASILGGERRPAPRFTAPEQSREGRVLVTRFFPSEYVTPRFTREFRTALPGPRNRNCASARVITYTYSPDSTLLEKELSWENAWGQQLRYRSYKAFYRGTREKAPFSPARYHFEWTGYFSRTYDNRGNMTRELSQVEGERPAGQYFRYRYKAGLLVARDEYNARGPYLRERYRRYPNGLLRELKVYEGQQPHLLRSITYRYTYQAR